MLGRWPLLGKAHVTVHTAGIVGVESRPIIHFEMRLIYEPLASSTDFSAGGPAYSKIAHGLPPMRSRISLLLAEFLELCVPGFFRSDHMGERSKLRTSEGCAG